jgi:hypothetical protein
MFLRVLRYFFEVLVVALLSIKTISLPDRRDLSGANPASGGGQTRNSGGGLLEIICGDQIQQHPMHYKSQTQYNAHILGFRLLSQI